MSNFVLILRASEKKLKDLLITMSAALFISRVSSYILVSIRRFVRRFL